MKNIVLAGLLMFLTGMSYAVYPDLTGNNLGDDGECKTIWVGSTTYSGISATNRELDCYTNVYNQGSYNAWWDYDTSVSTGNSGQTYDVNGYVTGEDNIIPPKTWVTIPGKSNIGIWFRTGDPAGTTLNIGTLKYVP